MEALGHDEARNLLGNLFSDIGRSSQQGQPEGLLGGIDIGKELQEFIAMPAELAIIFTTMGFDLAELVLKALYDGGVSLVKGLTPA